MKKDIDIIIYGATGFTGQLCVKYFQSLETKVNWAIAGRNLEKLKKVAHENQLMAFLHDGFWHCIDTKRDKDNLEEIINSNKKIW